MTTRGLRLTVSSAVLIGGLVAVALTGCAPAAVDADGAAGAPTAEATFETLAPDGSVHAVLDEENEQIHLPMEEYYMTSREVLMSIHATDLRIDECLQKSGRSYSPVRAAWNVAIDKPDRGMGVWGVANASRYGYESPPDPYTESVMSVIATDDTSEAQLTAEANCRASVEQFPAMPYGSGLQNESMSWMKVADDGVAYGALEAGNSESATTLREALDDCFQQHGFAIAEDQWWTPAIPADQEQAVKQAVLDAQCHRSTGIVQQLSDIEAQFQSAYIAEHEAELSAIKARIDGYVDEAQDYVAAHGG